MPPAKTCGDNRLDHSAPCRQWRGRSGRIRAWRAPGGGQPLPGVDAAPAGAARAAPAWRSAGGGGLDLASARLVLLDRLPEVAILRAAEEAGLVELDQVLLGLARVVERQVGLADVLVGALVLGIDGQRLLVDRDRAGRVAVLPGRVGEPVERVGVLGLPRGHALEQLDGSRVVAALDRLHRGRVVGVFANGGLAEAATAAAAPAATSTAAAAPASTTV